MTRPRARRRRARPTPAASRRCAASRCASAQGELLAVVGPSGSGKSTLLHIMGTLERPTSGGVAVAGHDVAALGDRALAGLRARRIGFVFQQFLLLDGMSALDNVATGLLYTGRAGRRAARARAREVLERVGLGAPARPPPAQAVGRRAPAGRDRPRARRPAGDPARRRADRQPRQPRGRGIWRCCASSTREGATIVVITHDREIAAAMPRRVEIRDGLRGGDADGHDRTRRLLPPTCCAPARSGCAPGALRAVLSALGIAIGIAAMVAVLGISASSQRRAARRTRPARHQPAARGARASRSSARSAELPETRGGDDPARRTASRRPPPRRRSPARPCAATR